MIPADIDPSLCAAEPLLDSLDGGFSPLPPADAGHEAPAATTPPAEHLPSPKSPF